MLRLKNRKGIFVVLFGLLFMVLMGAAAMSIDMSRIWTMRNELQTSADAAALAGAIQLTPPHTPGSLIVKDSATQYALLNKAQHSTVTVDSVELGVWDDDAQTFTEGETPTNAVHVVVSHPTNKLIMSALGIAAPRVKARATAWADAPVHNDACMRPWSIPYVLFMMAINEHRWPGAADNNSAEKVTRPFEQPEDLDALKEMTEAERRFTLKLGGGGGYDDPPPGGEAPGNYQAIKLPKYWDAATDTYYPEGDPGNGAQDYEDHVTGETCHGLAAGDSVEVKTGNMAEPTVRGVEEGVCTGGLSANGDCLNADGQIGVDVKAAFHVCTVACQGAGRAEVRLLGSFTLTKVYPGPVPRDGIAKAQIEGIFNPVKGVGPVGGATSTYRRIILVR